MSSLYTLLFPLPQLMELPHEEPGAGAGRTIFDKREGFFENGPGDSFSKPDVNRPVFVVAKFFREINPVCLELTGDVFVFQGVEFLKNGFNGLHVN